MAVYLSNMAATMVGYTCSYTRETTPPGAKWKTTLTSCHENDVANQTMVSTRIRRHLPAIDCWKFLEYLENSERQYVLSYSK